MTIGDIFALILTAFGCLMLLYGTLRNYFGPSPRIKNR
jgi:hypothetical protein